MTPEEADAHAIYDILWIECGALESDRDSFVHHITTGCREYRCCHALGFGGKFRPETMSVDYYPEDETPERERIQEIVNTKLKELDARLKPSGVSIARQRSITAELVNDILITGGLEPEE